MKKESLKKGFIILAIAISGVSLLGGCGTSSNSGSSTIKDKKIVVGTNATFVPFEFKNEKTQDFDGFDIDLSKAIAKKMNAKVEIKNVGFDALIPSLQSKDIDLAVSGMTITKERAEKVLFSYPYYASGQAIVTKENNTDIYGAKDLNGHLISAQLGTTGADFAHSIEGAQVKEFNHSNEALLELKIGGVEATVVDLPNAQYYAKQNPNEGLKVIPIEQKDKEFFGIALAKDNKALQEEVNKALSELKVSGELDALYQKWFHQNAPTDLKIK